MIELQAVRGPLDEEQLRWVATLYGAVDPTYASVDYVRHQFVGNPFGWSVNVFAFADGEPIGHCGCVPFRARRGSEPLVAGKLEGLVVLPEHRGGGRVAMDIMRRLYDACHEHGMEVLFGLARPGVMRVLVKAGCTTRPIDESTRVMFVVPGVATEGWSPRRRVLGYALSVVQRALAASVGVALRLASRGAGGARVREPVDADVDLLATAETPAGAWTVVPAEAWEWYAGSGLLRVVETGGPFGARALVRLVPGDANGLQIVAWQPAGHPIPSALLLLDALRRLARRNGLPTVRLQQWQTGQEPLVRAARLLLCAKRGGLELLLHAETEELRTARVLVNPFFSVTF